MWLPMQLELGRRTSTTHSVGFSHGNIRSKTPVHACTDGVGLVRLRRGKPKQLISSMHQVLHWHKISPQILVQLLQSSDKDKLGSDFFRTGDQNCKLTYFSSISQGLNHLAGPNFFRRCSHDNLHNLDGVIIERWSELGDILIFHKLCESPSDRIMPCLFESSERSRRQITI